MIYTASAKYKSVVAGEGELDRNIRLSSVVGLVGDGDITEWALLTWRKSSDCVADLIAGDDTLETSPPLGDPPYGRSCGSGGDMDIAPKRTFSGAGLARQTGHVACDSSHTSTQLAWK